MNNYYRIKGEKK